MCKKYKLLITLSVLILLGNISVLADSVGISPSILTDITLQPGGIYNKVFHVKNNLSVDMKLNVNVIDYSLENTGVSIGDWFEIESKDVIKAGEILEVPVTINIPEDATLGETRTDLEFSLTMVDGQSDIEAIIVVPIFVGVTGEGVELKMEFQLADTESIVVSSETALSTDKNIFRRILNIYDKLMYEPIKVNILGRTYMDLPKPKYVTLRDAIGDGKLSRKYIGVDKELNEEDKITSITFDSTYLILNTQNNKYTLDFRSESQMVSVKKQIEMYKKSGIEPGVKFMLDNIKVLKTPNSGGSYIEVRTTITNTGNRVVMPKGLVQLVGDDGVEISRAEYISTVVQAGETKDIICHIPWGNNMGYGTYKTISTIAISPEIEEKVLHGEVTIVNIRKYVVIMLIVLILLVIIIIRMILNLRYCYIVRGRKKLVLFRYRYGGVKANKRKIQLSLDGKIVNNFKMENSLDTVEIRANKSLTIGGINIGKQYCEVLLDEGVRIDTGNNSVVKIQIRKKNRRGVEK